MEPGKKLRLQQERARNKKNIEQLTKHISLLEERNVHISKELGDADQQEARKARPSFRPRQEARGQAQGSQDQRPQGDAGGSGRVGNPAPGQGKRNRGQQHRGNQR